MKIYSCIVFFLLSFLCVDATFIEGNAIERTIKGYIRDIENFLDSETFYDFITPETIEMFLDIADDTIKKNNNPKLNELIHTGKIKEPNFIKSAIKHSIITSMPHIDDIVNILKDPLKLAGLLEELPKDLRDPALKFMHGEANSWQLLVDTAMESLVPVGITRGPNPKALTYEHKTMIRNFLLGSDSKIYEKENDGKINNDQDIDLGPKLFPGTKEF